MSTPVDEVRVTIGGVTHDNWTSYEIDSDLMTPADAWNVRLAQSTIELPAKVVEGAKVQVQLGQDTVLVGVLDERMLAVEKGKHELALSGRDGAGVLLDCSGPILAMRQVTLEQVIVKIVATLEIPATFGVAATGAPRLNLLRMEEDLSEAHLRLSRVFIECRPYQDIIRRFDKPGTFFYVDPPYWDCEDDYGKGLFSKADFEALAEQLASIKGRFILSLNDRPQVREIFKGFRIEAVKTRYSVSAAGNQSVGEVLISNFK